ncbi:polysaccharide lyase family protein [Streptomyces sp. WMMC500]|uniref:polysaccharide lyase family protein n=1 Tax=Streptomyces sp. WMMC500 TaxID=3015154 RepID=UPI00248C88D5|nr:polysaccharide lyase family protein [Streptomyces sp. WMMC500]WBB63128.1 polysaccharide lyase family protein [Streptomyces sp. WMMC500]
MTTPETPTADTSDTADAAGHPGSAPGSVSGLAAAGGLGAVELTWRPYRTHGTRLVDHYEVYELSAAGDTLLARTLFPHHTHRVGPEPVTRRYTVVAVLDSGAGTRPARAVAATNERSLAAGRPVAQVGDFDHRGLEFALSPNLSAQYPTAFPQDVDFRLGASDPARDWCYLHPGPADSWAGRREHTFTLRFDLAAAPEGDLGFALWLIDSHATAAGTAELALNGRAVTTLQFRGGATRGSLEGDAARPGSALKPSSYELPLAADLFTAGENVLTLRKTSGSWIAYDALGVFAADG